MLLGSQMVGADGHLRVGGCDTVELARQYGTPLYVIDEDGLRQTCRRYVSALKRRRARSAVAYACKAFSVGALLAAVAEEGLGVEVVSEGELALALRAGVPAACVTVHGNFKSDRQIDHAVGSDVGWIVIDSLGEAARIAAAARAFGRRQRVLLRVNPGVRVRADSRYSTAVPDSKFGLSLADGSARHALAESRALDALDVQGVHFHLGSQIDTPVPFKQAMDNLAAFLRTSEVDWQPHRVVVGGGMAARYAPTDMPPTPEEWAEALIDHFNEQLRPLCAGDVEVGIEPGRAIAAENGLTLYTVGLIKPATGGTRAIDAFVVVDGGLSDNPKAVMSTSRHEVLLACDVNAREELLAEVCGRHCGTDTLFASVSLPRVRSGDVLAIQCTGAYTHCMASNYNRFPRPAVVCVAGGASRLALRRETLDDLIRTEFGEQEYVHPSAHLLAGEAA